MALILYDALMKKSYLIGGVIASVLLSLTFFYFHSYFPILNAREKIINYNNTTHKEIVTTLESSVKKVMNGESMEPLYIEFKKEMDTALVFWTDIESPLGEESKEKIIESIKNFHHQYAIYEGLSRGDPANMNNILYSAKTAGNIGGAIGVYVDNYKSFCEALFSNNEVLVKSQSEILTDSMKSL